MPLVHSIAHIEYNATKAYIDTLIRFIHGVPKKWQEEFFRDLSQIAYEESLHFEMLDAIVPYGSLPVHQGLQSRITLSNDSLIGRLAIVSIVNEGRGMDTGENLVQKLLQMDLPKYAQIMKQILKDENKHVAIGLKWFKRLTQDPPREFLHLMKQYDIKCTWKINSQKRRNVGFDDEWLSVFRTWSF